MGQASQLKRGKTNRRSFSPSPAMADTSAMWRSKCNSRYLKADIEKWDSQLKNELAALRRQPHNRKCFDCGVDDTTWASPKLGVFICVACSDVHRAAGAHITCVKNFNTYLWGPDEVEVMKAVGNGVGKRLYGSALVLPSDSKDIKVAKCTKKYGGSEAQQLVRSHVDAATATPTPKERRGSNSVPEVLPAARTNETKHRCQIASDDWFDEIRGSMPISSNTVAVPTSGTTQPFNSHLPEVEKVDNWMELLSSVKLNAEKGSVASPAFAGKLNTIDLAPSADNADELELWFNSL